MTAPPRPELDPPAASSRAPGGTDIFSSERSFSPPIGERWKGVSGRYGYFIDFSVKNEAPEWPPSWLQPFDRQIHVAAVQWGLGAFERFTAGEGDRWLAAAIAAGDHLLAHQVTDGPQRGGWPHGQPMPHTYLLEPPWLSAITQGEGASLLARLHLESGEERFADGAREALRSLSVPVSEGGTLAELDGAPFVEEYPTEPPSYVLNGAMFALWGFYDVGRLLKDEAAAHRFRTLAGALEILLPRFDTGYWSRYDLYPHPLPNIASPAYHLLHINQLRVMEEIGAGPGFGRMAVRFEGYRSRRAYRARAVSTKVVFRLANPRNSRMALKLPWATQSAALNRKASKGGKSGSAVVLCYHAVSESWDAALSVTPSQLESQLLVLLARGYRGATFTQAVEEPRQKVVAVTFDDGYASVFEQAFPILQRLGLVGSLFVPTEPFSSDGPMSWPGIDRWIGGPFEAELCPMSWEQARTLREAGWEIGSHSRSHPLMTELSDADLAAELTDSKAACEANLGGPCTSVAFPYGDCDERVARAAKESGYTAGAALSVTDSRISPHRWPRIGVYHVDSTWTFKLKVSPAFGRLRRSRAWGPIAFVLRPIRPADPATG